MPSPPSRNDYQLLHFPGSFMFSNYTRQMGLPLQLQLEITCQLLIRSI